MKVKRQKFKSDTPYWQEIEFKCDSNSNETIATALTAINKNDVAGGEIGWECSCLQKKCGACAMVINGRPRLACDTFLKEFRQGKPITIEPLRKFPVVRDLIVDRSVMRENLKEINAWLEKTSDHVNEKRNDLMYDASRCLQCGCCLEVCPNFCAGGSFYGAASAVPVSRLINASAKEDRKNIKKEYDEHVYKGCGKSLACMDVCPAKIDIDRTLSSTNALAIWRK